MYDMLWQMTRISGVANSNYVNFLNYIVLDSYLYRGRPKHRKGPKRTEKDRKGPKRTEKDRKGTEKDRKGTEKDRKGRNSLLFTEKEAKSRR